MADAVVVVDMLRGFLEAGHPLFCGPESRRIIGPVKQLLDRELAKGSRVLFVCDAHRPEDPEIASGLFPPHCMQGTLEAEVVPELQPYLKRGEYFPKHVYSGFSNPKFQKRLAEIRPGKLTMVGVCTDICVLHNAADAFFRGYKVEVPEACVASFTEKNHQWGLEHLRKSLGAREPAPEPAGRRRR